MKKKNQTIKYIVIGGLAVTAGIAFYNGDTDTAKLIIQMIIDMLQ